MPSKKWVLTITTNSGSVRQIHTDDWYAVRDLTSAYKSYLKKRDAEVSYHYYEDGDRHRFAVDFTNITMIEFMADD